MIKADMNRKMEIARKKVWDAIHAHGGTTLLSTGISGDDARMAKAAIEAGARMLEPNHPAVALARGYKGVTNMHAAEQIRHEIPLQEMAKVTSGVRQVAGNDIYITVGIPGGFTEVMPTILSDEDFKLMSLAGADGLHVHKTDLKDLEEVVERAHKYGLLIDAYIGRSSDLHPFGIPADTPEEVAKVAKLMENMGVDFIGLMTGMSYEGTKAGEIPVIIQERIQALVESVKVPTLAEGGINIVNQKAFRNTGINILVVGTAIDDMAELAVREAVKNFIP
ncbi:hypothetical protein SRRS_33490 [Sporomusa rhizae]|uniref:thiamine phosphate synthase n=1 Tax=Sporomusa rhizae TaxID=357999 RepID=UPI00352B3D85